MPREPAELVTVSVTHVTVSDVTVSDVTAGIRGPGQGGAERSERRATTLPPSSPWTTGSAIARRARSLRVSRTRLTSRRPCWRAWWPRKAPPDGVGLRLSNYSTTAAIASANNATLPTVAANGGGPALPQHRCKDHAAGGRRQGGQRSHEIASELASQDASISEVGSKIAAALLDAVTTAALDAALRRQGGRKRAKLAAVAAPEAVSVPVDAVKFAALAVLLIVSAAGYPGGRAQQAHAGRSRDELPETAPVDVSQCGSGDGAGGRERCAGDRSRGVHARREHVRGRSRKAALR